MGLVLAPRVADGSRTRNGEMGKFIEELVFSWMDPRYLDFNGVVHSCVNDWSLQEQEEFLFRLIEVGWDGVMLRKNMAF